MPIVEPWPYPMFQEPPEMHDPVVGLTVGEGVAGLTFDMDAVKRDLDVQAAVTADAERLLAALMEPCEMRHSYMGQLRQCAELPWVPACRQCRPCRLRAAWAVIEKEMSR